MSVPKQLAHLGEDVRAILQYGIDLGIEEERFAYACCATAATLAHVFEISEDAFVRSMRQFYARVSLVLATPPPRASRLPAAGAKPRRARRGRRL